MATAGRAGLFTTKPTDALVADAEERGHSLKRVVGLLDLTALGIGAVIGTGIFVIIGEAIGDSGPAIVISFLLAGVTCAFSALSYAEMASTIPISGSAYTYAYATLGELLAWIIGWDLILEYGISIAAVAVGWGGYLSDLLNTIFGFSLPDAISQPPGEGGTVNLPAAFLVVAVAVLLIVGVRETARTNAIMVWVKLAILALFAILAFTAFKSANLKPFAPFGFDGIRSAAALIFFAYIGFDAISTSGEETKRPQRDMPIAILGALGICTLLYVIVAIAATGALPFKALKGSEAPLADVLDKGANLSWGATMISIGALIAITSVVITVFYGQTRIMFAMSRDGLVPRKLSELSARRTPAFTTMLFAVPVAVLAALVPLTTIAELVNIGTLFAFLLVNIGVMVLRRTQPDLDRGFRAPAVFVMAPIGGALCIYLMLTLPLATWIRFFAWMAAGLVIYFAYGRSHSALRRGQVSNPDAELT